MSDKHLTEQRFIDLDLPPPLLQGVQRAGFEFLTPIQALVLPRLLQQCDVAGQAQTGTGKTAAFLIAVFARLLRSEQPPAASQPRALILAPTRELAIQIYKDAQTLGFHLPFRLTLAYGGTGYASQRRELESGTDVLIGTPGRIIDYFKQGIFSLHAITAMVLDEADRMFDLGFIKDIRYLLRRMPAPQKRLNMLFSATLSLRVNELAYEHMNNPQTIKVESKFLTVDAVDQRVYFPANEEKVPLLIGLLQEFDPTRTLVFSNTKQTAESLGSWLTANGYSAGVLSGDVPQKKREQLLKKFKQGDIALLVATDVAARGLHIPDVSHVINFDLPQDPEDYVHRIGRTARAGANGDAISFACETHAFSLSDIEQYIGHKIKVANFDARALPQLPSPHLSKPSPRRKPAPRGARSSAPKDKYLSRKTGKSANQPSHRGAERSLPQKTTAESPEVTADNRAGHEAPADEEAVRQRGSKGRQRETPAIG